MTMLYTNSYETLKKPKIEKREDHCYLTKRQIKYIIILITYLNV